MIPKIMGDSATKKRDPRDRSNRLLLQRRLKHNLSKRRKSFASKKRFKKKR